MRSLAPGALVDGIATYQTSRKIRALSRLSSRDRNGERAAAVAGETGGVAVTVDVGDERSVNHLVAETLTR